MATVTFNPFVQIDFTIINTTRSTIDSANAQSYDFDTSSSVDIDIEGSGFTYDASNENLTGGTISRIDIDLGGDQPALNGGDINIDGLNITLPNDLAAIDNGAFSLFGIALQGNDTFLMGGLTEDADTPTATNRIFGDDLGAVGLILGGGSNTNTGGDDVFASANNRLEVSGDVWALDSASLFSVTYNGGDDTYFGTIGEEFHRVAGDAWSINRSGSGQVTLNGGDDEIDLGGNSSGSSFVAGDVTDMNDGIVNGGDDEIVTDDSATPEAAGDVRNYNGGTLNGGDDIITAANSSRMGGDVMFLNAPVPLGTFTITGGDDELTGGGGDDIIAGDVYDRNSTVRNVIIGGDDIIIGGAGDDDLFGEVVFGDGVTGVSGGNDSIYGGSGNDEIRGQTGDDTVDGGAGNDTIDGGAGFDLLSYRSAKAGVTVNMLVVGAQNTIGAGIDSILGSEALEGSRYDDTLRGNNVANEISGAGGNDTIFSGAGSDTLNGGAGNDLLNTVGQTDDIANGGSGDDTLESSGGGHLLIGGGGLDTVSFSTVTTNANIDLLANTARLNGSATSDTLFQIENAVGGSANDIVRGSAGANNLSGLGGHDQISGGDGDDTIDGGIGNDTLLGENGNDQLVGGDGADRIEGGANNDTLSGGGSADTMLGGSGDDLLNGDLGLDNMSGGTGNDTLNGGIANDTLAGDDGADVLDGGDFHDTLNGGADNDILIGGAGTDTYTGGSGADTMVFSATAGSVTDVITDFEDIGAISDDLIDVTAYNFASVAAITASADGNDAVLDFGSGDRVRLSGYLLTHTLANIGADDFLI